VFSDLSNSQKPRNLHFAMNAASESDAAWIAIFHNRLERSAAVERLERLEHLERLELSETVEPFERAAVLRKRSGETIGASVRTNSACSKL